MDRNQLRDLTSSECMELVDELNYQLSLDSYEMTWNAAFISLNVMNAMGAKLEMKDLIHDPPMRKALADSRLNEAKEAARELGVNFPE